MSEPMEIKRSPRVLNLDSISLDICSAPPFALETIVRTPFGSFTVMERIGKGAFAAVFRARWNETGKFVALKRFDAAEMGPTEFAKVMREVRLMKSLQHPNILRVFDCHKEDNYLYIVLELAEGGSLLRFVTKVLDVATEDVVCVYAEQIAKALECCHKQGIIHRDLKAGNVLLMKEGEVKLADFGVAAVVDGMFKRMTVLGSPYWMAPEVIEGRPYSTPSDIWSFGCTIHELLMGEPPNFGLIPAAAMFRTVNGTIELPETFSPELRDLLQSCLQKDPDRRPTATQLLQHPWFLKFNSNPLFRELKLSRDVETLRKLIEDAKRQRPDECRALRDEKIRRQNSHVRTIPKTSTGDGSTAGDSSSDDDAPDGSGEGNSLGGGASLSPVAAVRAMHAIRVKSATDVCLVPAEHLPVPIGSAGRARHSQTVSVDVKIMPPPSTPARHRSAADVKSRRASLDTRTMPSSSLQENSTIGERVRGHSRKSSSSSTVSSTSGAETEMPQDVSHYRTIRPAFLADLVPTQIEVPDNLAVWSLLSHGSHVYVGTGSGYLLVYKASTGDELARPRLHTRRTYSIISVRSRVWCSSEDGDIYILNPRQQTFEPRKVMVHDSDHKTIMCLLLLDIAHHTRIWSFGTSEQDCQVAVLNKHGKVKARFSVGHPAICACASPAGDTVWIGGIGVVSVMSAATGEIMRTATIHQAPKRKVMQLLPVGDRAWAFADRYIVIMDRDGCTVGTIELRAKADGATLMQNIVLVGLEDGTVDCIDTFSTGRVCTLARPDSSQTACTRTFAVSLDRESDSAVWASGPYSTTFCVWRLRK